jgi:hypothetical protein
MNSNSRYKFYQNSTSTTSTMLNSNGSANTNLNNHNKKLNDTLSMQNGPTLDINLLQNRFSARNIAIQGLPA